MLDTFELFGASFVIVMSLMIILWGVYFFRRNAGIVDLGWVAGFLLSAWAFLFIGDGGLLNKWVMTLMVTGWACRLLWHLVGRYRSSPEDPRYVELRKILGEHLSDFKFLLVFLFQGMSVVILSLPFILVARNTHLGWHWEQSIAIVLWVIGVAGEYSADEHLKRFKRDPTNKEKVCKSGLWRYSRHPNYFFEWVVWIAFALFAWPAPFGWMGLISPLVMVIFLTKVSGIPMAEARALESRGAAYAEYQKVTSPFLPLPPSRS